MFTFIREHYVFVKVPVRLRFQSVLYTILHQFLQLTKVLTVSDDLFLNLGVKTSHSRLNSCSFLLDTVRDLFCVMIETFCLFVSEISLLFLVLCSPKYTLVLTLALAAQISWRTVLEVLIVILNQ